MRESHVKINLGQGTVALSEELDQSYGEEVGRLDPKRVGISSFTEVQHRNYSISTQQTSNIEPSVLQKFLRRKSFSRAIFMTLDKNS